MLIFILAILLIITLWKWFIYYCAVRGLLYYLGIKYKDMPDVSRTKELTHMAMKRTIKEFFGEA